MVRHAAEIFSERVREWANVLLVGAILAPGERTVAATLRVIILQRYLVAGSRGTRTLLAVQDLHDLVPEAVFAPSSKPAGHRRLVGNAIERRRMSQKRCFLRIKPCCPGRVRWNREEARLTTRGDKRRRRGGKTVAGWRKSSRSLSFKHGMCSRATRANA